MSTILIVDDNEDIRELFATILGSAGFTTLSASSGAECLAMLDRVKPDLILLDIMMEPMDGWQTLDRIKSRPEAKDIPVFMLTGKAMNETEEKKYGDRFYCYLMKPIMPRQLTEAVSTFLKAR